MIMKSHKPDKKYDAYIADGNNYVIVPFGASDYEDYTIHKDPYRKLKYISRHKNEDWTDPLTAGFWSKHLLWNKPTLIESAKDITTNFGFGVILNLA